MLKRHYYQEQWIGYVWQNPQSQGRRIVVVVDDSFRFADTTNPTASHGQGLGVLFNKLHQLDGTYAIGFFDLPKSRDEADFLLTANVIRDWVQSQISDSSYQLFLLVDYFYGNEMTISNAHGLPFVDYWQKHQPLATQNIAYISIGGDRLPDQYEFEKFEKTRIQACREEHQQLDEPILRWLGIELHPLQHLWSRSPRWFRDDDSNLLVKHSFSEVCKFLYGDRTEKTTFQTKRYKDSIHHGLRVVFPDAWWDDPAIAQIIHDSLKCLCGAFFCGQAQQGTRKHISVGAAFLLALSAYYRIYQNIDVFTNNPDLWDDCSGITNPIFALQPVTTAQESAIALYDLFRHLFQPRSPNTGSQVKQVQFHDQGRVLQLQLDWYADQLPEQGKESLSQVIAKLASQGDLRTPRIVGNTQSAILKLNRQLLISESGFSSPGTVYMDRDLLVIASRK